MRSLHIAAIIFLFALACAVSGCVGLAKAKPVEREKPTENGNSEHQNRQAATQDGFTYEASDVERDLEPDVEEADADAVISGNTEFALDLYRALKSEPGNIFFSPYSISAALAMTWAGAKGETASQMADTLHFTLPPERFHPAFDLVDIRTQIPSAEEMGFDPGCKLNIINAIWGQQGYRFLPDFLDVLGRNYGAGLRLLDFQRDPDAGRIVINNWVAEQTEDKIQDLLPPGSIRDITKLVLTNAVYFNDRWQDQFDKQNTTDGEFHLLDGGTVTVPMMYMSRGNSYFEGDGWQRIGLSYSYSQMEMVIILPRPGRFEEIESRLGNDMVDVDYDRMEYAIVNLTLPRFRIESSFKLNQVLSDMGMELPFSDRADFSGMDGGDDIFISWVEHKAYVAVDEEGTEAAAATGVVAEGGWEEIRTIDFTADRPFIIVIRNYSGSILFVGRVMNPAG
jgi:serpin B